MLSNKESSLMMHQDEVSEHEKPSKLSSTNIMVNAKKPGFQMQKRLIEKEINKSSKKVLSIRKSTLDVANSEEEQQDEEEIDTNKKLQITKPVTVSTVSPAEQYSWL